MLLRVFLTDGDVPMDNNASERAIRGFCVGKKNWQMIDTINGVSILEWKDGGLFSAYKGSVSRRTGSRDIR